MHRLSYEAIEKLLKEGEHPTEKLVTIYLPTHITGSPPHMSEDQIRFKNLMNRAIDIIDKQSGSDKLARELGEYGQQLLDDKEFWENLTPGLLICARQGRTDLFYLPIDCEEYVAVDTHFHLAPALAILRDAVNFYVLNIAQHNPAIYEGDMYQLHPTGIELPESVEKALNIDEMERRQVQHHSQPGSGAAGYHGQRAAKELADSERVRFFRHIDKLVLDKIDPKRPLVLAGVDSDVAEYRDITKHQHVLDSHISGNHKTGPMRRDELFEPAQAIIQQEVVEPVHEDAMSQYQRLSGQDPRMASDRAAAINDAADEGRIDKLLIGMMQHTADTVRDNAEEVPRITFPGEEPSRLISDAAHKVWRTSGHIFNIDQSQMPAGTTMLAVCRY